MFLKTLVGVVTGSIEYLELDRDRQNGMVYITEQSYMVKLYGILSKTEEKNSAELSISV